MIVQGQYFEEGKERKYGFGWYCFYTVLGYLVEKFFFDVLNKKLDGLFIEQNKLGR